MELGRLNASYAQIFHILFLKIRELVHLPNILRANALNTNHDKPKLALWAILVIIMQQVKQIKQNILFDLNNLLV